MGLWNGGLEPEDRCAIGENSMNVDMGSNNHTRPRDERDQVIDNLIKKNNLDFKHYVDSLDKMRQENLIFKRDYSHRAKQILMSCLPYLPPELQQTVLSFITNP